MLHYGVSRARACAPRVSFPNEPHDDRTSLRRRRYPRQPGVGPGRHRCRCTLPHPADPRCWPRPVVGVAMVVRRRQ
ncbi:hypothetical protein BMR86_24485, partial [Stenotrophomonas sp. KAs 5-3]